MGGGGWEANWEGSWARKGDKKKGMNCPWLTEPWKY